MNPSFFIGNPNSSVDSFPDNKFEKAPEIRNLYNTQQINTFNTNYNPRVQSPGLSSHQQYKPCIHQLQSRKTKWTPEEDEMLRKSVEIHGIKNWTAVSDLVPGRNPKQCRERWTAQLDPNLSKDNWTEQEDQILLRTQKIHGNAWSKISTYLTGRSPTAVKNRYNWLSRRKINTQNFGNIMSPNNGNYILNNSGYGINFMNPNNFINNNNYIMNNNYTMNSNYGFNNNKNNNIYINNNFGNNNKCNYNDYNNNSNYFNNSKKQSNMYDNNAGHNSYSANEMSTSFSFDNSDFQTSKSLSGSLMDGMEWDDCIGFNDEQTTMEELCGDFNWL